MLFRVCIFLFVTVSLSSCGSSYRSPFSHVDYYPSDAIYHSPGKFHGNFSMSIGELPLNRRGGLRKIERAHYGKNHLEIAFHDEFGNQVSVRMEELPSIMEAEKRLGQLRQENLEVMRDSSVCLFQKEDRFMYENLSVTLMTVRCPESIRSLPYFLEKGKRKDSSVGVLLVPKGRRLYQITVSSLDDLDDLTESKNSLVYSSLRGKALQVLSAMDLL